MKSALFTANTSVQTVASGSNINVGSTVRKLGCCVSNNQTAILAEGCGLYNVSASITLSPIAAGQVTVQAYRDGLPIQGASASITTTAAAQEGNMFIVAPLKGNMCRCNDPASLTFTLTGQESEVGNVAVSVVQL